MDFPAGSDSKLSVYNARDLDSIPGLGKFSGEGNGNPLQYSCLENLMHRVARCRLLCPWGPKSRTRLSDFTLDFPGGSDGKVSTYNAGDLDSISGSGRSPGEGNGNPLQYSCLENPMDGGAYRLQSMGSQNRTRLSNFTWSWSLCSLEGKL